VKKVGSLTGQQICSTLLRPRRPGSVVGIATAYGLDGPGVEAHSKKGRDSVGNYLSVMDWSM
jgi:hypothetical protein